ncbi:hypothetical protein GGX14DRAFT_428086 [Mycena pura]|uniref:Uncharacterized protein n=1 Tax=Mycena pura TaxID=153505 RepID=A0AAD6VTX0_9AGAR|nr:hypothetical protein GGX14DRAFT_428086 [Mycena pura]
MSLPNLHTLKLRGIPRNDDSNVLSSFQRVVSGSSLRTLQLAFDRSSGNPTYISAFAAVLPTSLVSLDILWCLEDPLDPSVAAVLPCARLPFDSPTIQRLRLHRSPEAVALLNSSACPIDLGSIQHLDYRHTVHPALSSFLRRIGRTVDRITLAPSDSTLSKFEFHMLPRLVHIDCWLTEELIPDVIERLPVANCIHSLRVGTSHDTWQDASIEPELDMQRLGSDFEDAILRKLPYLTTVVVEVHILSALGQPNYPIFDATAVAASIRKSMPRLSSTQILSVCHVHDKYFRAGQRR